MNTYIYKAALWCESCVPERLCDQDAHTWKSGSLCDSDCTPIGPYGDGGGEADTPQHCDGCEVFLENPLTSDGYDYIDEIIPNTTTALTDTQRLWSDFYLD